MRVNCNYFKKGYIVTIQTRLRHPMVSDANWNVLKGVTKNKMLTVIINLLGIHIERTRYVEDFMLC